MGKEVFVGIYTAADVTIAVLNYNGRYKIPDLFHSITELDNAPGEVIMVDDGSSDDSREWVRDNYPAVRIIA
ncbi:MAG: glycosyltransferase, partial [Bacteroidetes bacterium]|nr:glycosyltransferase [Bacteroidota bacterium]